MQSNIQDLISREDELNEKVYVIAGKLVHNVNFDNYLKAHIQGCDYNYLNLLKQANTENYYKSTFSQYRDIIWCTIELKLAVWLSNYYKDKVKAKVRDYDPSF